MSNWDDNDAYYDDDAWFQAVTYDETDYQDVDAYLEPQAQPSVAPVAAAGLAGGGDAGDPGWDSYAGYDEFAALASQAGAPPETDPGPPTAADAWTPETESWQQPQPEQAWTPGTGPDDEPWQQQTRPDAAWGGYDEPWRRQATRPSRWLLVGVSAVVAAALGFSVVYLTHRGHQSLPSSALPSATASPKAVRATPASPSMSAAPPITRSAAQQVLAAYTTANNSANAQASESLLATVEGGGSLAIDAGIYDGQRASHAAPYPAYEPASASYYIPLESPVTYPHWFAVQVTNALSSSGKVFNAEYVVFTQAAAGAPWLDSVEPFVLPSAPLPSIALNANGYATAVSSAGTSLTLPLASASAETATALDSGAGQPASPGNLADEEALVSLKKSLPSHSSITASHSATTDPVFGLRTTGGGALLFYNVAARITLAAAPGGTLHLDIPGFVSPASQASPVTLQYLDQFAVNDPPSAQGMPAQVIADYSGLTGSAG